MKEIQIVMDANLSESCFYGLSNDREVLLNEIKMYEEMRVLATYEKGKRFVHYGKLLKNKSYENDVMMSEWESFLADANTNRHRASEDVLLFGLVEFAKQQKPKLYHTLVNECKKTVVYQLAKLSEHYGKDILEMELLVYNDEGKSSKNAGKKVKPTEMSVRELKTLEKQIDALKEEMAETLSQLDSVEEQNKALITELRELREKEPEVIVKKEVEVVTERVEVPTAPEDVQVMYDNYKALSDEVKRLQNKLSKYESNEGYLVDDVENIHGNVEGNLLDVQVPELVKLMKAIVQRHGNIAETTVGFKKMDINLFEELKDAYGELNTFLNKLASNVNKYC